MTTQGSVWHKLVDYTFYYGNRHAALEDDYLKLKSKTDIQLEQEGLLGPVAKMGHPALLDLGPGNFQLRTAIRLLEDYNKSYVGNDPLGLKIYNNDYVKLAHDLISFDGAATVKFSGLLAVEAKTLLSAKVINWKALTTISGTLPSSSTTNVARTRSKISSLRLSGKIGPS